MADIATQMTAARDKISRLLNQQTSRYPDIKDIGTATLRAAGGASTYGEALNAINAKKIQSLASAYKLLQDERKFEADEKNREADLDLRRQSLGVSKANLETAKKREKRLAAEHDMKVKANAPEAKALDDALNLLVSQENRSRVLREIDKRGIIPTPQNAQSIVAQVREELIERKQIPRKAPPKGSQRDRDVDALILRGYTRDQAEDIAAGRLRVVTDQTTGKTDLVNIATGEIKPVRPAGKPRSIVTSEARQAEEIKAVLDIVPSVRAALKEGVGSEPKLRESAERAFGQFKGTKIPYLSPAIDTILEKLPEGKKAIAARNKIRQFREKMIVAFSKTARVPVPEQKRILAMFDNLGFADSPGAAEADLESLVDSFNTTMKRYGYAPTASDDKIELKKKYGLR